MSFTPTQRRLLAVLADGLPHRPAELLACLEDSEADVALLRRHLSLLRRRLRPAQDVLAVYHDRRLCYRWVSLLASPDEAGTAAPALAPVPLSRQAR